tara:strand:+ start:318 stop:527 length:210 start_codon:yes stop_codon:yes gene_type:complete
MARLFEIKKIKDGWDNSLIIDETNYRSEHELEIGIVDPVSEEHEGCSGWIDLTKEEAVELRDFLNKHLS